jgi:hypothetical protein
MKQKGKQKQGKTRQRLPKWECVINGNDRQRASDKPRARATTTGKSLAYPEIRQTRSKVRIRHKQRPLDAAAGHHMDGRTDCRTDRCHPNAIRFLIRFSSSYHPSRFPRSCTCGLSDPAPTSAPSKKFRSFWDFMDGMKLSRTWSASLTLTSLTCINIVGT